MAEEFSIVGNVTEFGLILFIQSAGIIGGLLDGDGLDEGHGFSL
jgi:hypothetical protein